MSDVSIDTLGDTDNWHPHVEAKGPAEFNEEALRRLVTELGCVLHARERNAARHPEGALQAKVAALKPELDRALVFLSGGEPEQVSQGGRLLEAFERTLRFIWSDGDARPQEVLEQLAALTWTLFPHLTGAKSQTALLRFLGVKHKQQFNQKVMKCRAEFDYSNVLMRGDQARRNMKLAMSRKVGGA